MVRSFFTGKKAGGGGNGNGNGSGSGLGECVNENAKSVLQLLRSKGPPLSAKQLDYCSEACIERVLKAKGNNVKKATKQLRATLVWRAGLDVDYLTADEFSAELAGGNAYVAGLDDDGRPVLIMSLKPEIADSHQAQKQFIRYFVFTMEVAISCMPSAVEQLVLIIDAAACPKRSSISFSIVVQLLRLLGEHYPERLTYCFIVDAPSIFHFLWKSVSRVLDLKVREKPRFVSRKQFLAGNSRPVSLASASANHFMHAVRPQSNQHLWAASNEQMSDEDEEVDEEDDKFMSEPLKVLGNANCLGQPLAPVPSNSATGLPSLSLLLSSSSTLPPCSSLPSVAASPSLSPLASVPQSVSSSSSTSLQSSTSSSCASSATSSYPSVASVPASSHHHPHGGTLLTDKDHGRSLSFALAPTCKMEQVSEFRSFRADSKPSRKLNEDGASRRWADVAYGQKNDDFLHQRDNNVEGGHKHKRANLFRPYYVNFLLPGYVESAYRARMKPPLAGLISIISPDLKARRPSFTFHSTAMEAMLHHLHFD